MGSGASKPEKIYRAAKSNDVGALQDLLRSVTQQERDSRLLESADQEGFTPLLVASAKGHAKAALLLIRAGADIQHLTNRPTCSSALHEACAHGHGAVATLLLDHGASPFIENGRGLTAIDIAINNGNVQLLRRLEQHCPYAAYLAVKVPRYMGFGSEWKPRWCVIMPRVPNPTMGGPRDKQVARSLLVIYKAADQHLPVCKAWLDGAVARTVVGSRGQAQAQCALALHRSHAAPAGAHLTGDISMGYSMHLRPVDNRPDNVVRFRSFIDTCNHRQGGPAQQQHQRTSSAPTGLPGSVPGTPVGPFTPHALPDGHGPLGQGVPSDHRPGPSTPNQAAARKAQALGPVIADTGLTDEELAQRLQHGYDSELDSYLVENPNDHHMRQMADQYRGGSTSRSQTPSASARPSMTGNPFASDAPHSGHVMPPNPYQASTSEASAPPAGMPMYPQIIPGGPQGPQHTPSRSDPGGGERYQQQQGSAPSTPMPPLQHATQQSGSNWWDSLPHAPAPPAFASTAQPPEHSSPAPGPPGQISSSTQDVPSRSHSAEEDGSCVVCLSNPCSAGFVHGDSVHKCCCKECAMDLKQKSYPSCPMCRQKIEHIIFNFY